MSLCRSLAIWSPSEQQLLRTQWLRSGQCVRCFHRALPLSVEEGSSAEGKDSNLGPKRGPTRKERATRVSDEVSKLQQGQSRENGGNASKRKPNLPRKGAETSSGGEGPYAQGVGRVLRSEEDSQETSNQTRGVRIPNSRLEEPAERGESIMSETPQVTPADPKMLQTRNRAQRQSGLRKALGTPFKPQTISKEALLHSGAGSATIANGNSEGVIEDHLQAVVHPGRVGEQSPARTAAKFWQEQLVRFDTAEQAERVTEVLKKGVLTKYDGLEQRLAESKFERIPVEVEKAVGERMIKGVYDSEGLLEGKQKYSQPVLNQVAKQLLKNGTFLAQDQSRLLNKVRSLLPSATASAGKGQKAQQKDA